MITKNEIITKVRAILDEEELSTMQADVEYDNSIDIVSRIEKFIVPCAEKLCKLVSLKYLSLSDLDLSQHPAVPNEDGSGYIDLPQDFLRLAVFKMRLWRVPVFAAISDDSPLYAFQKLPNVRGGLVKPVVAVIPYGETLRLEYYSIPPHITEHEVEKAVYVKKPSLEGDNLDIDERLLDILCWFIARDVAVTFTDANRVKMIEGRISEDLKTYQI